MSRSRIPEDIPDLGKSSERLRQNPAVRLEDLPLTAEGYFVWSRLDGYTTLHELILMVGFPMTETIALLRRLRNLGAVLREGESPEAVAARTVQARQSAAAAARAAAATTAATRTGALPALPGGARTTPATAATTPAAPSRPATSGPATSGMTSGGTATSRPAATPTPARPAPAQASASAAPSAPSPSLSPSLAPAPAPAPADPGNGLAELTAEEAAAMAEDVELTGAEKHRILTMRRQVRQADYFALLGVSADVDKRALRRTYFALSKEFHPDRYYGKRTGSFGPWLAMVFETISKAFTVLSDDKARQRYQASLSGGDPGSQSRTEHAAELFERACSAEAGGDLAAALALFAATVRLDAQARYLGRAARCAMAAGKIDLAEEYAKNAAQLEPRNASVARVLADALRAAGRLGEAEQILRSALLTTTENDVLAAEIQADLDHLRDLRSRRGD